MLTSDIACWLLGLRGSEVPSLHVYDAAFQEGEPLIFLLCWAGAQGSTGPSA